MSKVMVCYETKVSPNSVENYPMGYKIKTFTLAFFLTLSCGKKDSNDDSSPLPKSDPAIVAPSLVGSWKTSCLNQDGQINQVIFDITPSQVTTSYLQFSDVACMNEITKEITVDSYTLGSEKDVDTTLISDQLRVETADTVTQFNNANVYGYTNWQLNVFQDVSGRAPSAGTISNQKIGQIFYNIFSIEDKILYIGDSSGKNDGYSSDKRPTQLNTVGFVKQ